MNSLHSCKYTRYWGKLLYYFGEINSTHSYAVKLTSKFRPQAGTVILADFQQSGRGQHGRVWQSARGKNLLISSIIYPAFLKAEQSFALNLVASIALHRLIEKNLKSRPVRIKWPNDIMVGDRKIAGILTQTSLKSQRIEQAIISIGLNVNQVNFTHDLIGATSLRIEEARSFSRQELLDELCGQLERCLDTVEQEGLDGLLSIYEKNFYGINQRVRLIRGDSELEGICRGVNPQGNIIIENENGEKSSYTSGSLVFLNP